MKQNFNVTGMTCSACSSRVDKAVSKLDGINNLSVNLLTNSMSIDFNEDILSNDDIISAVVKAGYSANIPNQASSNQEAQNPIDENIKHMKTRLIYSIVFLIPLVYVSMGGMMGAPLPYFVVGHRNGVSYAFMQFLFLIPIVFLNRHYYINGFKALYHRSPNMDSLIAVGSSAAIIYGIYAIFKMSYALNIGDDATLMQYHMDLYFEAGGTILALITVGKYLETKSKGQTTSAISKLIDLAPKTAIRLIGDAQETILAEQIMLGDILAVKEGMVIPTDGQVVFGNCYAEQSAITGESIPVQKMLGDDVIGGTINTSGYIEMKATKVGEDTTFAQIIKLVKEASASKAPIAKLADKVAGIFVPTVMTISAITFIVWTLVGADFDFALSSAITVLVISCPCALGLATPVSIMVGTGKGAENGILIKSGEALEIANKITTVVLDKTGTITTGKPKVIDVNVFGVKKQELLDIAYSIENNSNHPLALAVIDYTKNNNAQLLKTENYQTLPGQGLKTSIEQDTILSGNLKLMQYNDVDTSLYNDKINAFADEGKTPLLFAKNNQLIGIITVADSVKQTSKTAIQTLKDMGIKVVMLTGDNSRTANGVAKNLNLDEIISDVLPADKEKVVSNFKSKGEIVAMVGDGVNDSPALIAADVGIAIGAGADVALESADVVLIKNDLLDVVNSIALSKAVIKNIKQNLFWAFFYNVIGIPLAAGVFFTSFALRLSPDFGAAAMSLSSVFVVTNALRLKKFKPYINTVKEKKMTFKIDGMMCKHCQSTVEKALLAVNGVSDVVVSLEDKSATFNANEDLKQHLVDTVQNEGFEVVEIIA